MRSSLIAAALVTTALPLLTLATDHSAIAAAVDGLHRNDAARARDAFRHPVEVLAFCGLETDHQIVEIWPGGGWYADILAPVVHEDGAYTAAIFGPHATDDWRHDLDAGLQARFDEHPEDMSLGEPGSADAVYTFRNLHNWLKGGYASEMLATIYEVLEPGGTFCVVDHRANARMPIDPMAGSGYVDEGYAVQMITAAGFRLEAVSDINDNPRDTSDHPRGVWTLPPSLRLGDEDREHYMAIGESDRFTLRFVKPE
jgi:predicted methyltransferase